MWLTYLFVAAGRRKDVIPGCRIAVAGKELPFDPSCDECIQAAEEVSTTSDTVLARVMKTVRSEPWWHCEACLKGAGAPKRKQHHD